MLGLSKSGYQKIMKELRREIPTIINTGFGYVLDRNLAFLARRMLRRKPR
jgi:hypothetical protein